MKSTNGYNTDRKEHRNIYVGCKGDGASYTSEPLSKLFRSIKANISLKEGFDLC